MGSPASMMLGPALEFLQGRERAGAGTREIPAKSDCRISGNALDFEIDLPGVQKDNITVKIDGESLVVRGKRFMKTGERVTKITVDSLDQMDNVGRLSDNNRSGENKPVSKKEKLLRASADRKVTKKDGKKGTKKEDQSNELPDDEQEQTDAAVEVKTDNVTSEIRRAVVYVFESHLGYNTDVDGIKVICYMDGVLNLRVPMKSKKPYRTIRF